MGEKCKFNRIRDNASKGIACHWLGFPCRRGSVDRPAAGRDTLVAHSVCSSDRECIGAVGQIAARRSPASPVSPARQCPVKRNIVRICRAEREVVTCRRCCLRVCGRAADREISRRRKVESAFVKHRPCRFAVARRHLCAKVVNIFSLHTPDRHPGIPLKICRYGQFIERNWDIQPRHPFASVDSVFDQCPSTIALCGIKELQGNRNLPKRRIVLRRRTLLRRRTYESSGHIKPAVRCHCGVAFLRILVKITRDETKVVRRL